jgi:CBS-domain-containing membrane protein
VWYFSSGIIGRYVNRDIVSRAAIVPPAAAAPILVLLLGSTPLSTGWSVIALCTVPLRC